MRGRKPKPTNLRVIEGNPGKRAINHDEPKPAREAPPCPRQLKNEDRKAWGYLVRELGKMGTLASSDRADMTAYCHWWGVLTKAKQKLIDLKAAGNDQDPEVIKTQSGNYIQNPWLGIANTAAKELARVSSELGLNPVQRTRIRLESKQVGTRRERLLG